MVFWLKELLAVESIMDMGMMGCNGCCVALKNYVVVTQYCQPY